MRSDMVGMHQRGNRPGRGQLEGVKGGFGVQGMSLVWNRERMRDRRKSDDTA